MYKIILNNNKSFNCDSNTTIFEAAKVANVYLEHSCLKARCRSCVVKISKGITKDKVDDLVLTKDEKNQGLTLSCNALPTSDVYLDTKDLGEIKLYEKKIFPAKIQKIEKLNNEVIKVLLRLPPNANFKYKSGQYINLIKGNIKRSYSLANVFKENTPLEFFIKKYKNGLMSQFLFNDANENDLLRIEGPIGSFFLRESTSKNIIFLATGTGIAPIKAILEQISKDRDKYLDKQFSLFWGARYEEDIFWDPIELTIHNLKFFKVLSRESRPFKGYKGYVQQAVIKEKINLTNAQVYACGSMDMILSAKETLLKESLEVNNFFSDAFIVSN